MEKIVFLGVEWSSMGIVLFYLEKRKLGEVEFTLHLLDCHSRFSRFVKSIHSSLFFFSSRDNESSRFIWHKGPARGLPDLGMPPTCARAGSVQT